MGTASGISIDPVLQALLAAVHEGPHETSPWATFAQRLRHNLRANAASFSFRLDDGIGPGVLASSPMLPESVYGHVYNNGFEAVGPPAGADKLKPRRLYNIVEFLDCSIPDHLEFKNKIMEPSGLKYMRVACIPVPSGGKAWLAVGRYTCEFNAHEEQTLRALLPHLEISLKTFIVIERERGRANAAGDAVRKLDFCWLKLDQQCRILDMDLQAESMLGRSSAISRAGDNALLLADRIAQKRLTEAVAHLALDPGDRARAFHIADDPWLDMLIMPLRNRSAVDKMEPCVIAYVHGETEHRSERIDQLADLFRLTPGEATLALAICRGQSIRDASVLLGITEASAREYTKRIYAKTGARGQADLVRLVLTSVVALA